MCVAAWVTAHSWDMAPILKAGPVEWVKSFMLVVIRASWLGMTIEWDQTWGVNTTETCVEILKDWVTGRSPTQLRPRAWVLGLSAQRLRVRAWWLNGGLMYSRALATLLLRLDAVRCTLYAVRYTLTAVIAAEQGCRRKGTLKRELELLGM